MKKPEVLSELTETDKELGVTILYTVYSHWVDFRAYEIEGHNKDENGEWTIPRYDFYANEEELTSDPYGIRDKEPEDEIEDGTTICGSVKWDGCSHLHFGNLNGYYHACGKKNFALLQQLLGKVFARAGELIPHAALEFFE